MRNITRALAATACTAVIGFGASMPASAHDTTNTATGTLLAKGVAATVDLTFSCDAAYEYYVYLTVAQRSSSTKTTVYASGSTPWGEFLPCPTTPDSRSITTPIMVYPAEGQHLRSGQALGFTGIWVCDLELTNCTEHDDTYTIKFK